MDRTRLSLFYYDVLRELCGQCGAEKFHFVPKGFDPADPTLCHCGSERALADLSETSLGRLVTHPSGEMTIVPKFQR